MIKPLKIKKIYAVATPEYIPLTNDFFIPSVEAYKLEIEIFYSGESKNGPPGLNRKEFLNKHWKNAVQFKLNCMIKTIKENFGNIIIWSDVDVVFLNNPKTIILDYIKKVDVCGMLELKKNKKINGGFIVIKCSEKTLNFWNAVLYEVQNNSVWENYNYEQGAMNSLFKKYDINTKILPSSFWCDHRTVEECRPKNIIVYHQNWWNSDKYYNIKKIVKSNYCKNDFYKIKNIS